MLCDRERGLRGRARANTCRTYRTCGEPQSNTADHLNIKAPFPPYGTVNIIQPGEWVSIYGTNLAGATVVWNGDFPTSLGGTSVKINGKAAYLSMVSPGQINLQAPDDTASGLVPVVVTTSTGTVSATVTLSQLSPAFLMLDSFHVAGIILAIVVPEPTVMEATISWVRREPASAIQRCRPSRETWLKYSASGLDQPIRWFRLESRFPVRRRLTTASVFTLITSL